MKFVPLFFLVFFQTAFIHPQIDFEKYNPEKYFTLSKYNRLAYPGDPSFDVTYCRLNLTITYSPNYLIGEVTIEARSTVNNLDSLFLDLNHTMTVDSIISNSNKLSFNQEEFMIKILLEKSYHFNERFPLLIYYRGVPQANGFGSFVFDSHNSEPSIWSLSEPYGAIDWWPCKDTPADKFDSSDVWITCPANLIGVSNGNLVDQVDNRDGTKTYKWKNGYPIANYLISIAVSNYTIYENYFRYSERDSMPVIHYIYPEAFDSLKPLLDQTTGMLKIFSDLFGEYPFIKEKYGHAQFRSGGMEHQTITSIGTFTERVIVHELAHQWFGDKITCRDWQNIWLNEGFATYSEGLYAEIINGKEEYNFFISDRMNNARQAEGSIYVQNINSVSEIFSGLRSYIKGSIVLHMLRGVVGDSIFFRILKNYLNEPGLAYGTAVTEDFQRIAENAYGKSLEYFFNEWIYGENYPKYFIEWNYKNDENGLYSTTIKINQSKNTFPIFFTMPLQIKISTTVRDTIITLFNNQQDQSFNFLVEGEPKGFFFDPNNLILKDAIINDPLTSVGSFLLKQNYPNPFNSSTKIEFVIPGRSKVKVKLFDVLGNEIAVLLHEEKDAGTYTIIFENNSLSSGVYFYRLEAESSEAGSDQVFIETKKFIFTK